MIQITACQESHAAGINLSLGVTRYSQARVANPDRDPAGAQSNDLLRTIGVQVSPMSAASAKALAWPNPAAAESLTGRNL